MEELVCGFFFRWLFCLCFKVSFFFVTDWNSALFIILNGTKEEHLDMLDGGIIQRLLEEKWKTFARVCVFLLFIFGTGKGLEEG